MEMQRFEFSDGSSNKFWQIAREGATLRVAFGKIGTAGQAQLKELGSEAAAIAEHDKLVKEKTKKGYVLVGDAPATAAAAVAKPKPPRAEVEPAPAKAEPAVAPPPAVPAHQGDYVLEERYVGTRTAVPEGKYEDLSGNWNGDDAEAVMKEVIAGKKRTAAPLRAGVDAVVAFMGDEKAELDVVAAGLLLRLNSAAIAYLVARYGIAFAVDAYLQAHGIEIEVEDGSRSFKTATSTYAVHGALPALATLGTRAKPEEWAACLDKVRAAREAETSQEVRAEHNVLLRDEALVAQDAAAARTSRDWQVTQFVLMATRDPAIQKEMAGLMWNAQLVLDAVGLPALPWILPKLEKQTGVADDLFDAETVATAKVVANDLAGKNTKERAREYFAKRPDLALRALVPILAAGGKLAPFAKPVVEATLAAHPTLSAIVAPLLDPKARAFLTAEKKPALPEAAADAIPEGLRRDPTPGVDGFPKKLAPLPDFAQEAIAASPVRLAGTETVLPVAVVQRICQALRYVKDAPILAAARKACPAKDLAALGWELFERWQAAGAPNKEPWGFTALGLVGDDDTARKLTPLIRAWPGESLHARATVGLDVLATLGTDVALMNLHGIAQKLKFKGLQEKAREKIAAVAAARGFTADELADRLVPDFDLGEDGGNLLDFGPRSFTIVFDESLKPQLKGEGGKLLGDLPKPAKSDDAEKANLATERWKALKKDAKVVAAGQVLRLELAMCSERRWKLDVFRTFLVEHPLVIHLVRRLVWGVYDAAGALRSTFRVAEDGTFADADDKTVTVPDGASVGIVHRLSLDDKTLARWSTVLADYEIIQPFDQLGRQTFAPTAEEKAKKVVDHLGATEVRTSRLMGLESRGWRKGEAQDAGWVWDMWRTLEGGLRASFSLEGGFCMGAADMNPTTQKIGAIHFTRDDGKQVGLDAISPIVFSELARERESLRE